MKFASFSMALAIAVVVSGAAQAAMDYNRPPAGDKQYAQCLRNSVNNYTGGNDPSSIPGQTNVQAFCTCMWNETPDNFNGNLLAFSESPKGAATSRLCEQHSGWGP